MRERAGIITLRVRRIELCDKFAEKAAWSGHFSARFLQQEGRISERNERRDIFREFKAETDRLKNSPLFY